MLYLRDQDRELVLRLAAQTLPPEVELWVYGSRVTGRAHETSDLDLVLRGPALAPLPFGMVSRFRDALTESNLPLLVDVFDWARVPAHFHAHIVAAYVVLRPSAELTAG